MTYCIQDDNGSGKTIFFDSIFIDNVDSITYFTNETVINPELYVHEVLAIFRDNHNEELHKLFKIDDVYKKKISFLSSGELQSLKLYITFLEPRKNIILDEPTSFMDENRRMKFYEYIRENTKEFNVIITLHSSLELKKLSDEIYTLKQIKEMYEENTLLK